MDYRLIWTERALDDLDDIAAYVAADSAQNASRLIKRMFVAADRIKRFPHMGRIVPKYKSESVRELIVWPYRVVYQLDAAGDQARIARVVHGSRIHWSLDENDDSSPNLQ